MRCDIQEGRTVVKRFEAFGDLRRGDLKRENLSANLKSMKKFSRITFVL